MPRRGWLCNAYVLAIACGPTYPVCLLRCKTSAPRSCWRRWSPVGRGNMNKSSNDVMTRSAIDEWRCLITSHQIPRSTTLHDSTAVALVYYTHASHDRTDALSGMSIQRSARNVRNVTKWRHHWIGQSQPPATTAYVRCQAVADTRHKIWN